MLGLRKKVNTINDKLTPCLSGEELLKNEKIAKYVSEIKLLVGCSSEVFNGIYKLSLSKLAEYCQELPFSQHYNPEKFGFLERQLKLAISALKLRRGRLFPKNAGAENIARDEGMWTYAIFCVAIMHGLYTISNQVIVYIKNKNDEVLGEWTPIAGSLYEPGLYYQWHFCTLSGNSDDRMIQGALLSQIAPLTIFRWLHTNKSVFEVWFNAITNNREQNNEIIELIDEAAEKAGIKLYSPEYVDEKNENIHEEVKIKLSNDFFDVEDIQ